MNRFLDKDITYLNLDKNISSILEENNICKVNDLWVYNKKTLKNIGMTNSDIKKIMIKLELLGLELNKKYNK
ncbi:MAG: hypothetical protein IJ068_06250 [Bacilli bacterium]|nr:hypothetical protein [Bacilli bacterium]